MPVTTFASDVNHHSQGESQCDVYYYGRVVASTDGLNYRLQELIRYYMPFLKGLPHSTARQLMLSLTSTQRKQERELSNVTVSQTLGNHFPIHDHEKVASTMFLSK